MKTASTARFIDWADHSGCSQKVDGLRLEGLLEGLPITEPWADAATFSTDGGAFAGSTDLVLPMIDEGARRNMAGRAAQRPSAGFHWRPLAAPAAMCP